jgi:hypothetical protein
VVVNAFRALGPAARRSELAAVAEAICESGDEEALALFRPLDGSYFDRKACDAVSEIAVEALGKAGWHVALDLYTEVIRPGWLPFTVHGAGRQSVGPDGE